MPVENSLRIWLDADDYLTFDYAVATVQYEQDGERIRDREGRVHRIASATIRYPAWLYVTLPDTALTALNSESAASSLTALVWLERVFRIQSPLTVFVLGSSLDDSGQPLKRWLAYRCRLDELIGPGFCSLPGTLSSGGRQAALAMQGDTDWLELRLHVSEDGSFSDFDDVESFSEYTPALPT
jgi:hypothetical protein